MKTSDGTTFSGVKVTITSAASGNYKATLAFRGSLGNFWSKTSGNNARYLSIDTEAGTATDLGSVTLSEATSVAGLGYYAPKSYLAAVKRSGSTRPANAKVYLYSAADNQRARTLLTTATYTYNATDTAGQTSAAFGVLNGNLMLFTYVPNNGMVAYYVILLQP